MLHSEAVVSRGVEHGLTIGLHGCRRALGRNRASLMAGILGTKKRSVVVAPTLVLVVRLLRLAELTISHNGLTAVFSRELCLFGGMEVSSVSSSMAITSLFHFLLTAGVFETSDDCLEQETAFSFVRFLFGGADTSSTAVTSLFRFL